MNKSSGHPKYLPSLVPIPFCDTFNEPVAVPPWSTPLSERQTLAASIRAIPEHDMCLLAIRVFLLKVFALVNDTIAKELGVAEIAKELDP